MVMMLYYCRVSTDVAVGHCCSWECIQLQLELCQCNSETFHSSLEVTTFKAFDSMIVHSDYKWTMHGCCLSLLCLLLVVVIFSTLVDVQQCLSLVSILYTKTSLMSVDDSNDQRVV